MGTETSGNGLPAIGKLHNFWYSPVWRRLSGTIRANLIRDILFLAEMPRNARVTGCREVTHFSYDRA